MGPTGTISAVFLTRRGVVRRHYDEPFHGPSMGLRARDEARGVWHQNSLKRRDREPARRGIRIRMVGDWGWVRTRVIRNSNNGSRDSDVIGTVERSN